jgi:exopolyphosphatase/guanosine-5'-triphosphate,3'-diphosphate pyrophosphatase
MPTFAAIDIGSNSCRLAIASVQAHKLKTLHEDREVTRLGEGVFEAGVISPEAMANTIRALKRFHKAVQSHVVDQVRVVATSALRDARNSEAFRAWVKSTTGWNVEVISGIEEGRLIHLGIVTHEPGARGKCLLIDLGGGSCEITFSEGGRIREMVSLPLGAVRLQQEFLRNDPPGKDDVARLRKYIERELRRADRKLGVPKVGLVIATSGTAAALAEASEAMLIAATPKRVLKAVKISREGHSRPQRQSAHGGDLGGEKDRRQAAEDEQRAARGVSGDRAAALGDHHRRRAGVCGVAGAHGPEGLSLLAARAARRDARRDAGQRRHSRLGASHHGG